MDEKNRKLEMSDQTESETPAETPADLTSSDAATRQGQADTVSEEQESSEDLLDDVRKSLIEEAETDKTKKEAKWWRRLGRKEKTAEPEPPASVAEIDLPQTSLQTEMQEAPMEDTKAEEYDQQINELIDMLEAEHSEAAVEPSSPLEVETAVQPEPEIDLEQLKEQAFRPRSSDEEVQSDRDVRSIALEGGEEVFVEVEAPTVDPLDERLKSMENALKPYRSYIYMAFAFLGVVMAALAFLLVYNAYQRSKPEPVQEVSNLPYPVAVSLPGGWSFNLGRGTLQGGKWEPTGAEWLEGTEVCRWVSLPWSRQLEAVLRTLNPNDPIELVMSNNDKLTYGVYSVYEMTPEEIQKLDTNSPCLLLILTESGSEKRWVLTALP